MKRYGTITAIVALLVAGLLVLGISNVVWAHGGGPEYQTDSNTPMDGSMMGDWSGVTNGGPQGYRFDFRGTTSENRGLWGYMQNAWHTMMGGWGNVIGGMMGGWTNMMGGMMGNGWFGGMMGNWGWSNNGTPISADEVHQIAEDYVASYGSNDLEVAEIMGFDNQFYVQAREKSTGRFAFEFLIDRYTGNAYPEPGPNMMWNTKYGHMGGSGWGGMMGGGMMGGYWNAPTGEMPITPEQAIEIAQEYLSGYGEGLEAADEADTFYGYYTIHILKNGEIAGMLSVNGYTGNVWTHTWHGEYLGMVGSDEH